MRKQILELRVNGEEYEAMVEPQTSLLHVIREDLGLTGTKEGCGLGQCGACTVLVDDEPTLSCLTLAIESQGREIMTVEGLAKDGKLDALQQAFLDYGAVQCGYCTPGMLMSAKALLKRNPHPHKAEIKRSVGGNLCRCTGYVKIIEAIAATGEK
jgi:aerobic carbon-monoxide dehydrogenase small subunit